MTDIQKLQQKVDEAMNAPHLIDRLDRFERLRPEIQSALITCKFEKEWDIAHDSTSIKMFGIGMGITAVATLATAFVAGGLAFLAFIGGFGCTMLGKIVYDSLKSTKTKIANKREKHDDKIRTMQNLADQVDRQQKAEIERFRSMHAEERAGVAKLDELAGKYPEIREALIQGFRKSVSPVFEEGGAQARQQQPPSVDEQNFEVNEPEAVPA